jgi:hypothetical protein
MRFRTRLFPAVLVALFLFAVSAAGQQVAQVIANGGTEMDFSFGQHQFAVTYPSGFENVGNLSMTVLATAWNQQTFSSQRLQGTSYSNENCIVYAGTGGSCIVYSVTCRTAAGAVAPCPSEPTDSIAICTKFTPTTILTGTDFLKADPIGSNNWCSIWTGYQADPVVGGRGTNFSDFVATASSTGAGAGCSSLDSVTDAMVRGEEQHRTPGAGFCPNSN